MRFRDKPSHHIFIEPEGKDTNWIYPQGLNTSLPDHAQEKFLHTMVGLENCKILRYGYAVEYDFIYPDQLKSTLEARDQSGLFFAGQINGTSGYEEAAGQGIVAGINAALKVQGRDPFILTREDSFIGTMIDDLITKNIYEPYRMLTSRSEYRLLLRQDNAIFRLSENAYKIGLLTLDQISQIRGLSDQVVGHRKAWSGMSTTEDQQKRYDLKHRVNLVDLIKRPEFADDELLDQALNNVSRETMKKAIVEIRYEGYLKRQEQDIERLKKLESKQLPKDINYDLIKGLRNECRDKLKKYQPNTIYDAKRIAGVNPADIMIILAYLQTASVKTN